MCFTFVRHVLNSIILDEPDMKCTGKPLKRSKPAQEQCEQVN